MKIAVIGAGGVGGYFGGRLAAIGVDVLLRRPRSPSCRAAIDRASEFTVPRAICICRASPRPASPNAIGPVDAVLFTVKMYDVEAAANLLPPLIGTDTVVITLQNGVEAVDMLSNRVGREHVAGGVAYVAAVISEPGTIRHTTLDSLIFGELDGRRSKRLTDLAEAGNNAGFTARVSDAINVDLWSKFSRLSVFSGMTAVTRSPLGVVRDDAELMAMMSAAIEESIRVARACGVALPDRW